MADNDAAPSPPLTPQPLQQYQHPPLQVSFDSIPRGADDIAALPTPPIQQQESILTALAQSVAQDDEDEDEQYHATNRRNSLAVSSSKTKTIQDKGNGWALLTQPRTSAATPPSPDSALSSRNRASTLSSPSTSSDMLAISSAKHPQQQQRRPTIRTASPATSSPVTSRPSTPTLATIGLGASGPVDCDTPSRKSSDATKHRQQQQHQPAHATTLRHNDARGRPSISGGGASSMELPAEGSGLRGKDENDDNSSADAAQAQSHHKQSSASDVSAHQAGSPSAAATPDNSHAVVASSNPLNPPPARKLCIRHQRMADEGTVGKLQRSIESLPLADQTAVNSVWSIFSSSSHARRALILQGILSMCCFSQLSLLSSELALAIRIDPFSLFPREVSLKVLSHLDAMSLGRAAQVSRSWRALADDDLLWRNMCEQHIERKCDKCGWGLPLLSEKRRRVKGPSAAAGTPESRQLTYAKAGGAATSLDGVNALPSSAVSPTSVIRGPASLAAPSSALSPTFSTSGNLKRSITAAANAAALERHSRAGTTNNSRASSPTHSTPMVPDTCEDGEPPKKRHCPEDALREEKAAAVAAPATRPWKSVYCERLAIERNWRRGRYTIRSLKGHTDGIMCLQFNEALSHPSFPVAITGSYDRTARIWNMDTGEELRVLRGHTRGVRCLQFDEAKLITGSMDRTLKIWNWRTGDLVRTLEGHTEGIVCLNFNDHLLASGSADSNIKIWNFKTGQCHTLRGHTDWVNAVTLWSGKGQVSANDDGAENTFLFSASDDGTIRLWDLGVNECLMVFTGHVGQCQGLSLVHLPEDVVETLAHGGNIGPNGANVARNGDAPRRNETRPADAHEDSDYFTPPDGSTARGNGAGSSTSSTTDGVATANAATGQSCGFNPPSVPGGRSANTGSAPSIPDHFYNAPASGQHRTSLRRLSRAQRNKIDPQLLKLQDRLQTAGLVDPLPIDAEMGDLEWGAAKRKEAVAGGSSTPAEGGAGDDNAGATGGSHHARLRPMLFSCSLDNTIKIWDVRTGVCIRTLFGHMAGLWALSTDRLRLATASHDSTLKVWELATGKHLFSICEHRGPVTCVQIGDDKVVSGSDDSVVNIYSFTGEQSTARV